MGIPLGSNFDLTAGLPLDSRVVVADLTARDNIPAVQRFVGLEVYVESENKKYRLEGGILDGNWVEQAGGSGGNYVDLTTAQTVGGEKTWSNNAVFNGTVTIVNTNSDAELLLGAGNAALQYLSFGVRLHSANRQFDIYNDTGGIRIPNTGNLEFYTDGKPTSGTLRMIIEKSTGRVGIGVDTPLAQLHIDGGVGTLATGIAFGDGDTGFYELSDDVLNFSGSYLQGSASASFRLMNEVTSYTNPIYASKYSVTTGMGFGAADQLSLIAGGIEGLRIDEATVPGFVKVIVNPDGATGVNTGLWFGDGNTGFYEESDNVLIVEIGTVEIGRFETTGATLSNRTTLSELLMSAGVTPATEDGGLVWWNDTEYTLNIATGLGPVLQAGQETLILIYNPSAVDTITNFTTLRPLAATLVGGVIVPTVQKTDSSTWIGVEGTLMVATMDIPPESVGFAVRFGRARGGDGSGTPYGETWSPGEQLYISETPGELTNVRPEFPAYNISVGGVINNSASPDGEIFVSITRDVFDTILNFWNGVIRESFSFTVTEAGGVITGHLDDQEGDGWLTYMFEDGFYLVDTSSSIDVVLTAGTDTAPVTNYVYILESTKALTVSTSSFPAVEHIKIAQIVLQSAATVGLNGALRNQNWNDHIQGTDGQGHLSHITEKLRQFECQWNSGTQGSSSVDSTPTPDDVWVVVTSGSTFQLHEQSFPAFNTETGDHVHVVNHFTTPYLATSNLNVLLTDALGNTLNNTSFSFVLWGVQNSGSEPCQLMLNLPIDSYAFASPDSAVSDALNHAVYEIPAAFQGVGFLIARFTYTYKNDVWVLYDTEDLRGRIPNSTAGGGGGGGAGVTEFTALNDTPSSYTGQALSLLQVNAGETALEYTTAPTVATLYFNDVNTYIDENTNELQFTDTVNGSVLLSALIGTPTYGNTGQIPYSNTGTPGDGFNYSSNLFFDGSKLGIGTSSPNTALHVFTANTPALTLQRDSVNGISVYFQNADGGLYVGIDGNEDFGIGPNLDVGHADTYFTILKTTGYVGIGTPTPVTHLEVSSSSSDYAIKVSQHTGTGYAPASILLEATTTDTRGQGIFCYNTVADRSWFSGAAYTSVNNKWIIASQSNVVFDPIVAHLDNALFTVVGSTGNVGIGTVSPNQLLEISGVEDVMLRINSTKDGTWVAGDILGGVEFRGSDGSGGGAGVKAYVHTVAHDIFGAAQGLEFGTCDGTNPATTRMTIKHDGKVGIAVTTPNAPLDVYGAASASVINVNGTDTNVLMRFQQSDVTKNYIGYAAAGSGGFVINNSAGSTRLIVTDGGSVGIGTTSPAYQFEMVNTSNSLMQLKSGASSWAGIYFGDTDANGRGRIYYNHSLETFSFSTQSAVRMTLDGNGRLGIGTATPSYHLEISQSSPTINFVNTASSNKSWRINSTGNDLAVVETAVGVWMTFQAGGNVGIGDTSPTYKLDVTGSVRFTSDLYFTTANTGIQFGDATEGMHISYESPNYVTFKKGISAIGTNFYITSDIPTTYIYSASIYLGSTSGTTVYLRGNGMIGNAWVIDTAGKAGFGTTTASYTLDVEGTFGVSGVSEFGGDVNIRGYDALKLYSKTFDYVWMEFYADPAAQTTRSGYFGFASTGTHTISLKNQYSDGDIYIHPGGTSGYVALFYGNDTKLTTLDDGVWVKDNLYVAADTNEDVLLLFRQGLLTPATSAIIAWDDSVNGVVIQHGSTLGAAGRAELTTNVFRVIGSTSAVLQLVSTSTAAYVICDGVTGQDAYISYRENGATQFIAGHDASSSLFQIHSGTAFTTAVAGDFSISMGGQIYMGNLSNSSYTPTLRYNSTSGEVTYYSSDRSLKHNIRDFEEDAISVLSEFKPRTFEWNDDGHTSHGWIAQEGVDHILNMFPLVEKTGLYAISETEILPYFHKAIMQLEARIKELESQLK
jgi:hypothetical protein